MTKELAIKILSTRDKYGVPCGYTSGYQEALDMAIEALKERLKSEWIPCSERLPKDGQGVLVTVDDNEFDIKVGSCIYSDGVFFSALYDLDVIAWMPLPKPYGEREGE